MPGVGFGHVHQVRPRGRHAARDAVGGDGFGGCVDLDRNKSLKLAESLFIP
ncbi:MAG: hypothetical protein ACHQ15_05560 [Candidatus Limnocylindrales bacterium]